MQLDIGVAGLGLLASIAVIFGLIAQVVLGLRMRWIWLIGAVAWFVGGFVASEMIWGTMTVEEIQPIIDGLALDESLLGGVVAGIPAVLIARYLGQDRAVPRHGGGRVTA
jgi:hypothetical protein